MGLIQLSFALVQYQLDPFEQLALIIVSDKCDEIFTRDEAIETVESMTSLTWQQATKTIDSLINKGNIDECKSHRTIDLKVVTYTVNTLEYGELEDE